jgi:hypothetical protein
MSNVIPLGNITRLNLPTDRVLDSVKGRITRAAFISRLQSQMAGMFFGFLKWQRRHCWK